MKYLVTSPHTILEVDKNSSREEITEAYREKVLEVHPDVGGSKEEFQRVKKAYKDLMDEEQGDRNFTRQQNKRDYRTSGPSRVEYIDYSTVDTRFDGKISESLFEKAREENIPKTSYGSFKVRPNETVLEGAERHGLEWPYSCRGGACANCAIVVVRGDVTTPKYHILSEDLLNAGFRLSCIGKPITKNVKIIFNAQLMNSVEHLLLPSRPGE